MCRAPFWHERLKKKKSFQFIVGYSTDCEGLGNVNAIAVP